MTSRDIPSAETDVPNVASTAFRLPDRLAAKADPMLIEGDEQHFWDVANSLREQRTDVERRLEALRRAPGGSGQAAMDRDMEIHRLTSELRLLQRFGLDLCLGRMVRADGTEPVYVGRRGLVGVDGRRLLVDWRAPVAEPFFAATHADPMGLVSRRRYRWAGGRVSDYWDEVFTPEGLDGHAALDDPSAFIASLGAHRSARMRDVLATIQADQDAIIRAGSPGALVVEGGPGTGKTVVALHRAAYLLYSEPRIARGGGGVLFVGPTPAYLAYVDDVLPSLGEESVQLATLSDLVPEGERAAFEPDPGVALLKASARLVDAIETAVKFYEKAPTKGTSVSTPWADLWLSPAEWAEAFDGADPGTDHNEAREQVWETLLDIIADKLDDDDVPPHLLHAHLARDEELTQTFARAWPLLDPASVVADLWSVPAYLRMCAPWLTGEQIQLLQRDDPRAWTTSDLPLLDAARQRIGDPERTRLERRRRAQIATEREQMSHVVDNLIAADDGEGLVTMLRGQDLQKSLIDEAAPPRTDSDLLAGPFGHIIVDEAQELTDAQWRMLLRRCPSRSFTIVGDRAQARRGFTETWQQRLERVGISRVTLTSLSVNYRTPAEIMAEAEPVIRRILPDATVPLSIRTNGIPITHGTISDLAMILDEWRSTHPEGLACVIGDPTFEATARVRSLSPEDAKGLEFDLVVLVDPDSFGTGLAADVDQYVAMTRATERLVILINQEDDQASLRDSALGVRGHGSVSDADSDTC